MYYTPIETKQTAKQSPIRFQRSLKIRKRSNRPSGRREPIGRHG
nr:MAG TPA: hypothetical protein [Caudoviricetes sp.]